MPEILDVEPVLHREGKNTKWAFRFLLYALLCILALVYQSIRFQPLLHSTDIFDRNRWLLQILNWVCIVIGMYFALRANTKQEPLSTKLRISSIGLPTVALLKVLVIFLDFN